MSGDWSGLGFDPAPGNMSSAQALVDQLNNTSKYLKETHDVLENAKTQSDVWTGEASKAFVAKLDKLPQYLNDAHTSLSRASGLLGEWKGKLDGYQTTAKDLERRAKEAKQQVATADQAVKQARGSSDLQLSGQYFDNQAALDAAQQRYNSAKGVLDNAKNQADKAEDMLDDLIKQAKDLQDRHEDEAERIADLIETAGEDYSPDEGFFEAIGNWLERNAELLNKIGDIAGVISAIAGVLAFIPILAPIMGPIAIVAGAVALGAHALGMVGKGKYGWEEWVGLGADVLGVIPGVGAVAKGVNAAGDAASMGGKVVAGAKAIGSEMGAASDMVSSVTTKVIGGHGPAAAQLADSLAKGVQGTISMTAQVPTVVEWVTPGDTEEERKKGFGVLGLLGNVVGVK